MDIVFFCDGDAERGFGHVARCISLAEILDANSPGRQLTFCGCFDDEVLKRIYENLPGINIETDGKIPNATVAVIDRMPDKADPDAWDDGFLESVCHSSDKVIFIASGSKAPAARNNLTCVGYQPFAQIEQRPDLHWGMQFAPVPPLFCDARIDNRDIHRAFVGIGGGGGRHSLALTLEALNKVEQIHDIDVLVSPVAEYALDVAATEKPVTLHRNLPTVAPLLARAGLVIVSYGNLLIEALSLGSPVCVVGQKAFQSAYGEQFEKIGLAISGGNLELVDSDSLVESFVRTLNNAAKLSAAGRDRVDDKGLLRLAALIDGNSIEQFSGCA